MKKNLLLAFGLSLGAMCVFDVPVAHAGTWGIESVSSPPPQSSPDYASWQENAAARYPGNVEITRSSPEMQGGYYKPYPSPPIETTTTEPLAGSASLIFGEPIRAWFSAGAIGGPASVSYDGQLSLRLRYAPSYVGDMPSETDLLYLKIVVSARALALDGDPYNQTAQNRSKEHVQVEITPGGDGNKITVTPSELQDDNRGGGWGYTASKTFYLKVEPKGALEVTVPAFDILIKAYIDGDRSTPITSSGLTWNGASLHQTSYGLKEVTSPTATWNGGNAKIEFSYSRQLTNYFLQINSDLEDSWKKLEGELPQEYKKRVNVNVNGVDGWQPDPDKAQLVSLPSDASQIWRVKCQRSADGSITVESAAAWVYAAWKGKVSLTANPIGFSNPQYSWSLKSGGSTPYSPGWTLSTWNLSSEADSVILPDSGSLPTSTFEVTVTNSTPPLSLVGNYNVKWHYPYEPYHKRPSVYNTVWRNELSNVDDGSYFGDTDGNTSTETNPYETTADTFIPVAKAGIGAVEDVSSVIPAGKDIADILTKFGGKATDWYQDKYYPSISRHFTGVAEAWAFSQEHQKSGNTEVTDPKAIGGLIPTNLLDDSDGWVKCNHQVFEIVHWRRESWDADVYRYNGYASHDGIVNSDEPMGVTVEVVFNQVRFP